MASTDTPFGLSFDDMLAQARSAQQDIGATQPTPAQAETPAQTAGNTGNAFGTMNFNEMVAQAQANAAKEPAPQTPPVTEATQAAPVMSFDDMMAKANPAGNATPVDGQAPAAPAVEDPGNNPFGNTLSFEEMAAQAAAACGMPVNTGNTSVPAVDGTPAEAAPTVNTAPDAPVAEASPEANPGVEETAQDAPAAAPETMDTETPVTATASETAEPSGETVQPVDSNSAQADSENGTASKPKRRRKKKASDGNAAAVAEEAAVLEDTTEDYRINMFGDADGSTNAMDALFTPEEVEAFRNDLKAFVRKELKAAVVGAVKDMLSDFGC